MFRMSNPFAGMFTATEPHKANPLLPPVETHTLDEEKDKRSRRLTHLIRANHINHSICYHNLQFNNHMAHILGSAYIFGAEPDHLSNIYDEESKELEPWSDAPSELRRSDWRLHLGDPSYQRAYLDFFEDEVVRQHYNWRNVLFSFLTEGDEPLINGVICGLGHPLIHLGYAMELDSRELAMEALTMVCVEYSKEHEYIDHPSPPPFTSSPSPMALILRIRDDTRFDGLLTHPGGHNREILFDKRAPQIIEYFHSLTLPPTDDGLLSTYEQLVDTAILIFTTTHKPSHPQFDFFLVHLVTSAHALRIVFPNFSIPHCRNLVRQHWYLVLVAYFSQMRPLIKPDLVKNYDIANRTWDDIATVALKGNHKYDAHFVKALRAFKEFEKVFGKKEGFYLKAACKLAGEFEKWGGFGEDSDEGDIRK